MINLSILLFGLTAFGYWLTRSIGHAQQYWMIPFLYYIHAPVVLNVLSEDEHQDIHDKADIFQARITLCVVAFLIATICSVIFVGFLMKGSMSTIIGIIMAISFATVIMNWKLASDIRSWVDGMETNLLTRVIARNADAGKHATLREYLDAENLKLINEYIDDATLTFENAVKEAGFDPNANYSDTEIDEILDRIDEIVEQKLAEQSTETTEK